MRKTTKLQSILSKHLGHRLEIIKTVGKNYKVVCCTCSKEIFNSRFEEICDRDMYEDLIEQEGL